MKKQISLLAVIVAMSVAAAVPAAMAHGSAHRKNMGDTPVSRDEHEFGRQGDAKNVSRTVNVDMNDNMRFTPSELTFKQGETVRFVVHNNGKANHEMVLGTLDELKAHGELMKKFPEMEHDEPYMAHVAPGGTEEMVWQFTRAGDFHFGCLAPGHFESGMVGKIKVTKG